MTAYEHRHKFGIDIPGSIGGLMIDDRVVYQKDGAQCIGYIYCFRQFGYTWFASGIAITAIHAI